MKSSLLLRLTALRLKPEVMAEVCAIINEIEAPFEARKAKDRERKPRKIRGNSVENPRTIQGNSTPVSVENPPVSPTPPLDSNLSSFLLTDSEVLEKKEDLVVARESKPRASRGHRLPDDWAPNAGHYAAGKTLGYANDAAVDEQAKDMRIWANANGHRAIARKSDWDLSFLGWLRRNKPKCAIINGYSGFAPRPGSREDRAERTHNALRKLHEYVEANADVPSGGGSSGGAPIGLLPFGKSA